MFRRLLIATIVGILAAFAVAGFRHAMLLLEWLFLNNDSGSLVNAATNLSPWRRLLTPALGGLAAGLLLMGWQKFTQQRPHAPTDYMEALQTDGQFDYAASLVKSLASLLVVTSGSAIGREGAMILLAAELGLRIGDIRSLKFSEIDWELRREWLRPIAPRLLVVYL